MEEISKFLTEAMGECWHEWPDRSTPCVKCGQRSSMSTIGMHDNFLTWGGFGKLWKWANKQEWWGQFLHERIEDDIQKGMIFLELIHPENFAKAVVGFLQKK